MKSLRAKEDVYPFDYSPTPKFASFTLSSHHEIPEFVKIRGNEFQNKFTSLVDSLFNVVWGKMSTIISQSTDQSDMFAVNLKFLLILTISSNPYTLFSMVDLTHIPLLNSSSETHTDSELRFWADWLYNGKLIKNDSVRDKFQDIISKVCKESSIDFRGSKRIDLEKSKRFLDIVDISDLSAKDWTQKTIFNSKNDRFEKLFEMISEFTAETFKESNFRSGFEKTEIDLQNRYSWYNQAELDRKMFASIILNKTYILDHRKSTGLRYSNFDTRIITGRYQQALHNISDTLYCNKMNNKYYLDYVSFWDQADFIYTVYTHVANHYVSNKRGFYDILHNTKMKQQNVSRMLMLCSLLSFIPTSALDILASLCEKLEVSSSISFSEKTHAMWLAVQGLLCLGMNDNQDSNLYMSSHRYKRSRFLVTLVGSWTWRNEFIVWGNTFPMNWIERSLSSTSPRIGNDIYYIPIPHFDMVFSLHLEDEMRKDPKGFKGELSKFTNKFKDHERLITQLYDMDVLHHSIVELQSTNINFQNMVNLMKFLYDRIEKVGYLLINANDMLRYIVINILGNDDEDTNMKVDRYITTIFSTNPAVSSRSFLYLSTKVDSIKHDLLKLNSIVPKTKIDTVRRREMKNDQLSIFEKLYGLLLSVNYFAIPGATSKTNETTIEESNQILRELTQSAKEWKLRLHEESEDLSQLYAAVSVLAVIFKNLATLIYAKWNSFIDEFDIIVAMDQKRVKRLKYKELLNGKIQELLRYLASLEIKITSYSKGDVDERSNMPKTFDVLPRFVTTGVLPQKGK